MDENLYKWIVDARSGDADAFAVLVGRFKTSLFRYAYGMLGDRMEAEDAVQEAFIKAYYSLAKLDNPYAFASWLTRIASNLCYDRLQKRKKAPAAADIPLEALSGGGLEPTDLKLALQEALVSLTPEHREAVLLRDLVGYSYEEIAAMLDIPLGTVKSRLNAARLVLRKAMKRETED